MNLLTPSEEDVLDLLEDALLTFGPGRVKRLDYLKMMGRLTEMRNRLVNRMFGCQSGRHSGVCLCERNVA